MGDVQNARDLWLTYGTYVSNGRCMEHSCFTVDVQGTSAPWKMQNQQSTDKNYLSVIGINFPTPSPTT